MNSYTHESEQWSNVKLGSMRYDQQIVSVATQPEARNSKKWKIIWRTQRSVVTGKWNRREKHSIGKRVTTFVLYVTLVITWTSVFLLLRENRNEIYWGEARKGLSPGGRVFPRESLDIPGPARTLQSHKFSLARGRNATASEKNIGGDWGIKKGGRKQRKPRGLSYVRKRKSQGVKKRARKHARHFFVFNFPFAAKVALVNAFIIRGLSPQRYCHRNLEQKPILRALLRYLFLTQFSFLSFHHRDNFLLVHYVSTICCQAGPSLIHCNLIEEKLQL